MTRNTYDGRTPGEKLRSKLAYFIPLGALVFMFLWTIGGGAYLAPVH